MVKNVSRGADRIRAGALAKTVGWGGKADEPLPPQPMPESEQQPLAPQKQYAANIGSVVRALTRSRANGQLLHEPEWQAYEEAIASGRCAAVTLCISRTALHGIFEKLPRKTVSREPARTETYGQDIPLLLLKSPVQFCNFCDLKSSISHHILL